MRKTFLVTLLLIGLVMLLTAPTFAADDASQAEQAVNPSCVGSLTTRLVVGQTGRVARQFSSLRHEAGGPAFRIMRGGSVFTVVDGPRCVNNLVYFRLDYGNNVVGWANESQVTSQYGRNLYWLEPYTVPATNTPLPPGTCEGSLAPRLVVNGQGTIAQRFSTLRRTAGGPAIRTVFAPRTFTVLEGPVCAGGLTYFRIDYGDGLVGWANESQRSSVFGANQYWLAPAAPAS
jgi:hypothetical protein